MLKYRARKEIQKPLQMVPHLTECLMEASDESMMVADLVCLTVALRPNPVSHPLLDSKRYIWCEV